MQVATSMLANSVKVNLKEKVSNFKRLDQDFFLISLNLNQKEFSFTRMETTSTALSLPINATVEVIKTDY
jgi:hypothetical protein